MLNRTMSLPFEVPLAARLRSAPGGDLRAAPDPRQVMRWAVLAFTAIAVPLVLLTAEVHLAPGIRYSDVFALCTALGLFSLVSLVIPWQRLEGDWLLVLVGAPIVFVAALNSLTGAGESPYFAMYAPLLAVAGWYLSARQTAVAIALVVGTELWRASMLDGSRSIEHLAIALPFAVAIAATASLTGTWLRAALLQTRHEQIRLAAALEAVRGLGGDLGLSVLEQLKRAGATLFEARVTVLGFDALTPTDVELAPAVVDGRTATVLVKGAQQVHALVRLEARHPFSAQDIRLAAILAEAAGRTLDAQQLLEQAQAKVECDPLTGLLNRRAFDRALAAVFAQPEESAEVALLFVDIDDFKQLNDTYGHAAGDAVLVQLAGILGASVRQEDGVYRYGGDEFAILLNEADQADAKRLARRIARRVAAADRRPTDAGTPPFTVSIGSAAPGAGGATPTELLKAADQDMYALKRQRSKQPAGL